jgi:hypothetical protein
MVISYRLGDRDSLLSRDRDFSVRHPVQTGSGAYPMGTRSSFTGVMGPKPPTCIYLIPKLRMHAALLLVFHTSFLGGKAAGT